jgi:acyl-CoA synthetase (AMP-forming)/AMP-acid ligase II
MFTRRGYLQAPMEYNLADLWEAVADVVPEREALICGERRLSYADTEARANRLAHYLASQGIGRDDHVALLLYNSTEYLEGMLAALKLRAVPINVNYRYMEEELRYILDDCDAKAIVFHAGFASKLAAIAEDLPMLANYIAVDEATVEDPGEGLDAVEYETALASASPVRDFGPRSGDDHYILYTGGTTGNPKGVMWRAEDIFFGGLGGGNLGEDPISRPEEIVDRLDASRRTLPACPLMHGTAHWFALGTLYTGGTVILSPDRRLDPPRLWELIAREHVTFLVIVGDAFARPLVEALDTLDPTLDLSSLTVVLSGGAILSPTVKQLWVQKLPGTILIDGFGSSESGGQGSSVTAAGGPIETAPRFRVDSETTVLDDNLEQAAPGVIGRLARRGHVPVGYYKDPVKTAATFPVVDGVRWSVPGDHARIEDDGTITVLGRGSVSINTGGEKVYPEEVESAVKSHPAVFDAVVVGVPDDRWGERVVAVVQLRPGATLTVDELVKHVRAHLADYKAPRDLVLVDAVVRSPSGKPDYRWARATADAELARVRSSAPR